MTSSLSNEDQIKILNSFADAKAAEGEIWSSSYDVSH